MKIDEDLLHQLGIIHGSVRRIRFSDPADDPEELHGYGRMLNVLRHHPGITQKQLAETLEIRPQSLTVAIKKLEMMELLEKKNSPKDQRQKELYLTQAGIEAAIKLHNKRSKTAEKCFGCLNEEEKKQLYALLSKVSAYCRSIEKEAED